MGECAPQALPGPLFNFAAYLGVVIGGPYGALVWSCGIFAPGVLLVFACLPLWGRLRDLRAYKAALPGLHASAVGLIFASCFQYVFMGIASARSAPSASTSRR